MNKEILDMWSKTMNDVIKRNSEKGLTNQTLEQVNFQTISDVFEKMRNPEFINEYGYSFKDAMCAHILRTTVHILYNLND